MTFNPVWHGMLYSCTHIATVGMKKLNIAYDMRMYCSPMIFNMTDGML